MQDETTTGNEIAQELQALREEVKRLNGQRFFRLEASFWRVTFWSLARGLAFGLGSVLGATILISVLVRMLGTIDFIPVLGDWASQVIDEIQSTPPK